MLFASAPKEANFQPPAVIVVGDVVKQREELQWIESKPLFGRRILVTRARSQASELADRIDELGGEPYEFPVIETRLPDRPETVEAIRTAMSEAESYDWVILTSVNGVEFFFRWLELTGTDIRRFHRAEFAAVGPKTAEALRKRGIVSSALPERFRAESLLDSLGGRVKAGQKALLPRGDLARELLPRELEALGVESVSLDVYETVPAGRKDEFLLEMLQEGGIHAITFTSSSTVTNLLAALREMGVEEPAELLAGTKIACIGPVTAKTAEENGLSVTVRAESYTLDGLVQALIEYC